MEEETDFELLRASFWRYLNILRGLGAHAEPLALGTVIALVALMIEKRSERMAYASPHDMEQFLKKVVTEFEHKFLFSYEDLSNIYHVPYENPELYRFLYEATSLFIELDVEVLQLVDMLYQLPNGSNSEYVTPPHVAELMARLTDVSPEDDVLDPSMGSGGFLNAAQEQVRAPFKFWGSDTNAFNRIVVRLKVLLSVQEEDYKELPGSAFAFAKELPKFDVVLSNPPIRKLQRHEALHMYSDALSGNVFQEMSVNFIELGIQHLKVGGRAAFLVPLSVLFSSGDTENARRTWLERKLLKAVITLPPNLLAHTGLRCAILFFENNNLDESVRFIIADECYESGHRRQNTLSKANIQQILSWSNTEENFDNAINVSYQKLVNNNYSLIPNEYLVTKPTKSDHLSEHWVKLDDVAEIYQGTSLSKLNEGSEYVIRGRDLRTNQIDKEGLARKDLSSFLKPIKIAKKNDILLQRIGKNPAAYLVKESDQGIAVEDTVFIIRCKDMEADVLDFICQFLNSGQVATRISNARGYSVVPTQSLKTIRSLEVPMPDQKIVDLVKEMNALEASLKKEYEKAREYKRALFDGYDSNDISSSFEDARFTANALEGALKQKDDITYRVRTQYPFPLAYAFRNIYLEREYAGIYERQMKYGEQLLSFLSAVGICLCIKYCSAKSKIELEGILKDYHSYITRGVSPGDLQTTLQKTCKLLAGVENSMVQSFSQVWYKSGGKKESVFAKDSRDKLVSKLNDYKHHRGPANKHERKLGGDSQAKILESMLTHIEFLSDWDIIRIDEIDKRWRNDELEYSASLLKGDHPAFEQIRFSSKHNLSLDKLYIRHGTDFICLYPLISLAYNPQTRHEEIFTIDKSGKNSVLIKSFESGSSVESKDVMSDLLYLLESMGSESEVFPQNHQPDQLVE